MDGFTKKHDKVFELVGQYKYSVRRAAETMDVSPAEVRQLLQDMKQSEHGAILFPVESDRMALGRSVTSKARPKMYSYDDGIDDGQIKDKF